MYKILTWVFRFEAAYTDIQKISCVIDHSLHSEEEGLLCNNPL